VQKPLVSLLQTLALVPSVLLLPSHAQAGHVRRFFFADTLLGTSSSSSAASAGGDGGLSISSSAAVVFASQLSLVVQIQPGARNRIRPPLMTLK
jgi:hypothetical protein